MCHSPWVTPFTLGITGTPEMTLNDCFSTGDNNGMSLTQDSLN